MIRVDSAEYIPTDLDLRMTKYRPLKKRRPALKQKNKKSCMKKQWAKLSVLSFMLFSLAIQYNLYYGVTSHSKPLTSPDVLGSCSYSLQQKCDVNSCYLFIGDFCDFEESIDGIMYIHFALSLPNKYAKVTYGNKTIPRGIRNLHLNIRSLRNKISEVRSIVNQYTERAGPPKQL